MARGKSNLKFCIDCVYYIDECHYPGNLEFRNTPLEPVKDFKRSYREINRDNNCSWYRQRGRLAVVKEG